MKIFISGATGFIGSRLALRLARGIMFMPFIALKAKGASCNIPIFNCTKAISWILTASYFLLVVAAKYTMLPLLQGCGTKTRQRFTAKTLKER